MLKAKNPITIEEHHGVKVLRDDLLPGGTKSVALPFLVNNGYSEYVYASPVYGGFQIALAKYCKAIGKKATIFCAQRNLPHRNSIEVAKSGGVVIQIPHGYLTVVSARAREYVARNSKRCRIEFGANDERARKALRDRVRKVMRKLGEEPDEIWCAIGSGTLFESILGATHTARVIGVEVGKGYRVEGTSYGKRFDILRHHLSFEKEAKISAPFPSTPNYDLKAWEYCLKYRTPKKKVLFWNVL